MGERMLAFIHVQKTAGSTMKWILRSSYGARYCPIPNGWYSQEVPHWVFHPRDLRFLRKIYSGLKSISGHSVVPWADLECACPDVRYFTLMRDPIKRCVSNFQHNLRKGVCGDDLEDWLKEERRHDLQTKKIAGAADVDSAIRTIRDKNILVGLVGRFDETLLLLKALVANDLNIDYQRKNVAPSDAVTGALLQSERTRDMISEANQMDLQLWDYVRNEVYPRYLLEYGRSLQTDLEEYRARNGGFNWINVCVSEVKLRLLCYPLLRFYRGNIRGRVSHLDEPVDVRAGGCAVSPRRERVEGTRDPT